MSKYPDDFRASVVVMLQSEGYPDDEYALGRVYNYLKSGKLKPSKQTIKNWFDRTSNPPPSKILDDKKRDMQSDLRKLFNKLIQHALNEDVISEMSGQQAVTSMGIVFDKIRLLMGLPTQIVSIMPEFVSALERVGEKPEDVMRRLIDRANQRAEIDRQ